MGVFERDNRCSRWRQRSRVGAMSVGMAILACFSPGIAIGGEWTASFGSLMSTTYKDNPSLASDGSEARTDITLNRTVDAKYAKDRYRIDIAGHANLVASMDEIADKVFAADQIRYKLNAGGEYDMEAAIVAAAFGVGFDTVQNTEFEDTGQLSSDVTRTNANLNFRYSRKLNELWSFNISDSYSLANYSGGNFINYSNNSVQVGFTNSYSERLSISPSIGYSRYSPDSDVLSPSNSYRITASGQYQLSEIDTLSASLGLVRTGENLGTSVSLGYRQQVFDRLTVKASVIKDHLASGEGNVRQSTGLSGGLRYQITEYLNASMNASWRRSSQVTVTGSADTTQLSFNPSVAWTYNEEWRAGASLQIRQQTNPANVTAISNAATIFLKYNLPLEF